MLKTDKYTICTELWKELKKISRFNDILINIEENHINVIFKTRIKRIKVKIKDDEIKLFRIPEIANIALSRLRDELYCY